MTTYKLEWKGEVVLADFQIIAVDSLIEYSEVMSTASQQELYPGHGKVTGTLQRSIHPAGPDYPWAADKDGAGGSEPAGLVTELLAEVVVGSGLIYAKAVHDGHGSFSGYQYVEQGSLKTRDQLPGIVAKHAAYAGYTG